MDDLFYEERRAEQKAVADALDRQRRTGAHVLNTARSLGWKDDGEGALEFLLRRAREVAFEDCKEQQ